MTTVTVVDRWFDEYSESLLGLPVAEAVLDVMSAGLHVEVSRPDVHRVREQGELGVVLVVGRAGIVLDVLKLEPSQARRRRDLVT